MKYLSAPAFWVLVSLFSSASWALEYRPIRISKHRPNQAAWAVHENRTIRSWLYPLTETAVDYLDGLDKRDAFDCLAKTRIMPVRGFLSSEYGIVDVQGVYEIKDCVRTPQ